MYTKTSLCPSELEVFRKQAETERKAAEELARERDMLNKVSAPEGIPAPPRGSMERAGVQATEVWSGLV